MLRNLPVARSDSWWRGVFPRSALYSDPSMTPPSESRRLSLLDTSL